MGQPPTVERSTAESAVYQRYSQAARQREEALCCPVSYRGDLLKVLPPEILERDYGCGDPSPWVREGDVVVDLGSGGGKLCYIMAQVVGPRGRVIGVDCNREMLQLARKYQSDVAAALGFDNVEFRYGIIQDLKLDLDKLQEELAASPVANADSWMNLRQLEDRLRHQPMVADGSVDCVVSNCVLNLVRQEDRSQLFQEVFRVLKRGGRAAISDIVSDEDVPDHLRRDGTLWSGCISGAFREDRFLQAFQDAGFHGITIEKRQDEPWQVVEGIEFRSMTVVAWKDSPGPRMERNQAVVYKGPFQSVVDEDGQVFVRGERTAVCDRTFERLQKPPYDELFVAILPHAAIPLLTAAEFDDTRPRLRSPQETKGADYRLTSEASASCCGPGESCC